MKGRLRIGPDLEMPLEWLQLSSVIYGARGSGKTTLGRVLAEEAHKAGVRFCAIDIKGDWWGLKSTADGRGEGIPVVVFGGDHADVPLEPGAGAELAAIIAELDSSTILDFENLSKTKQIGFLADFFERLYDLNRDPLVLLLDESQRYAPQGRTDTPQEARCLGAMRDIVKLGRKHGLGPFLFTQRGAGLDKECSELSDILIAFRTPGVLDQKRIKEWLEANVTADVMRDVMQRIAGLDTGTSIFASAHPKLRLFETAGVRLPETFDSSATPEIGQAKREPKRLASPDLKLLEQRMAAAIERAKADDPKELRRRIADLEQEVRIQKRRQAAERVEVPVEVRVEVPVVPPEMTDRITDLEERLEHAGRAVEAAAEGARLARKIGEEVGAARVVAGKANTGNLEGAPAANRQQAATPARRPSEAVRPSPRTAVVDDDGSLSTGEKKILAALALNWPSDTQMTRMLATAGFSRKSSQPSVLLRSLKAKGLVEAPTKRSLRLTDAGHELVDVGAVPQDPISLRDYWRGRLAENERLFFDFMVETYPGVHSTTQIAIALGYSPTSSQPTVIVRSLRDLGLIVQTEGGYILSEHLT